MAIAGPETPEEEMMEIRVAFPGEARVEAHIDHHCVMTDQSVQEGGGDAAPNPFALFLASLATCAGHYVLKFCRGRGIATEGLALTQRVEVDPMAKRVAKVSIEIHTPPGFPEKYREAVIRAAEQCTVKRALFDPPEVEVTVAPALAGACGDPEGAPGRGPRGVYPA
jgi:ribosomal protein S12 methylthiotransferase accessory factor